eukprot:362740-Chlamydomonas_euryale.AAC.5
MPSSGSTESRSDLSQDEAVDSDRTRSARITSWVGNRREQPGLVHGQKQPKPGRVESGFGSRREQPGLVHGQKQPKPARIESGFGSRPEQPGRPLCAGLCRPAFVVQVHLQTGRLEDVALS